MEGSIYLTQGRFLLFYLMEGKCIVRSPRNNVIILFLILTLAVHANIAGGKIITISTPEFAVPWTPFGHPYDEQVFSVSATPTSPLDNESGIGWIINPNYTVYTGFDRQREFCLHIDSYSGRPGYLSPYHPDPTMAVVTYEFDEPTIVNEVEIYQHQYGVSEIQGYIGDSLGSLTLIEPVFSSAGNKGPENDSTLFEFNNSQPGLFFQLVVSKTDLDYAFGLNRAFLYDSDGAIIPIPEPASLCLLSLGVFSLLRRKKS